MRTKLKGFLSALLISTLVMGSSITTFAEDAGENNSTSLESGEITAGGSTDDSGDESDSGSISDSGASSGHEGQGGNAGPGGQGGPGGPGGQGGPGGAGGSQKSDDVSESTDAITDICVTVGANETALDFTWYSNTETAGRLFLAEVTQLSSRDLTEMPATSSEYMAVMASANKSGYYTNKVSVSGLNSDSVYAYELVNGENVSAIYYIQTGGASSYSFALIGDAQLGASGSVASDTSGWQTTLAALANMSDINFLLSVGDQIETATSEAQYDSFINNSILAGMPVAVNVGNHDTGSDSYTQHFNLPNMSSTYGVTNAGGDYYYVYDNTLFMCLNTNNSSVAEHKTFMEETIEATKDMDIQWKVVTFHHSIYSVARHASDDSILSLRSNLAPVLEDLDVDVVLMGHDHVYCRSYIMDGLTVVDDASKYDGSNYSSITDPDGILYVTVNSASGSKYYSISSTEYEYAAVMNQENTTNITRVNVTDSAFTITTYRVSDMSVVDTFTINKTVASGETADSGENDSIDDNNTASEKQTAVTDDTNGSNTADTTAATGTGSANTADTTVTADKNSANTADTTAEADKNSANTADTNNSKTADNTVSNETAGPSDAESTDTVKKTDSDAKDNTIAGGIDEETLAESNETIIEDEEPATSDAVPAESTTSVVDNAKETNHMPLVIIMIIAFVCIVSAGGVLYYRRKK